MHAERVVIVDSSFISQSFSQAKFGDNKTTIYAASLLELESTNKGLLLPRVSLSATGVWGLNGTGVAAMMVFNNNASITGSSSGYPALAGGIGIYYWDGAGWVGVKTNTGQFWSLTGNTGTTASTAATGATVNNNFIGSTDSKDFVIATNNLERMRVSSSGYIGINNSSPLARLHIINDNAIGAGDDDYIFDEYGSSGDQTIYMRKSNGTLSSPSNLSSGNYMGGISFVPRFGGSLGYNYPTGMQAYYSGDGTNAKTNLRFYTTSTERVRIDDAGNIGVGTSSPTNTLHVYASSNPLRLEGLATTTSNTNVLTVNGSGVVTQQVLPGTTSTTITQTYDKTDGSTTASNNFPQFTLTTLINTSNTFSLPSAKTLFITTTVGIDDYTVPNGGSPYYVFELYIDGAASGIKTGIQEPGGVGQSMNFTLSGVKALSAGSHTIDLRGTMTFPNGAPSSTDIRLISFYGVYTYFN